MVNCYYLNDGNTTDHVSNKNLNTLLPLRPRTKNNLKHQKHFTLEKQNEWNLFPNNNSITCLYFIIYFYLITFPSILFPTPSQLINNHLSSIQWLMQLASKQWIATHNLA